MKTVTALEAKAHFSDLVAEAARGETIVVTRRGKPMAQIGPLRDSREEARDAMRFLLSQEIKLGVPVRKAVRE
ncbi:MAG TPA: type II toxin-antitoxin system prevent-host-death family antitoxin [Candidatus Cybelea sp.]